jgi:hypothetical protein
MVYVQERDAAGNWSETAVKSTVLALRREVAGLSAEGGYWATLISSKDGQLLLAYHNAEQLSSAEVKRFNGQVWEQLGDPSSFGSFNWNNSAAVSQSGIPYLALVDSLYRLTVVRYVANQWRPIGPQRFTPGGAGEVAIAISREDIPYVAFRDDENAGLASVMRWNGTSWENVGPRGISAGFSVFFSIAFTTAGNPIVAYLDNGYRDADLSAKVMIQKYNAESGTWLRIGDFPLHEWGNNPFSLVVTEEDSLFIALNVKESSGAGEVYKFNGSAWIPVGNHVYQPPPTYPYPFLGVVPQGNMYVAFTDFSGGQPLGRLRAFRGGSWIDMPSTFSSTEVRGMTLSPEGVPWVLLDYQGTLSVWKMSFDP